jgi:hypothetical protein
MLSRLLIFGITAFFIVMNVLLWRWELSSGGDLGSPVAPRIVFERILTAPDFSSLEIFHHGQKVGQCRWVPSIGEDRAAGAVPSGNAPPEGMVKRVLNYTLDLSGTVFLGATQRVRFSADVTLSTNHVWQEVGVHIGLRPMEWTLKTVAAEEKVHLTVDDGTQPYERVFAFSDLRNPEKLLLEFGGPLLPATLAAFGFTMPTAESAQNISVGLKWEAHQDRLEIGNARLRCYRLRARLFDRHQVVLFVSRVGEIFRVELPDEIVLRNEALASVYEINQ